MNRQQEFETQIERNNQQAVNQLLNDDNWSWLRKFYEDNFDEIAKLLRYKHPRLVLEDFCNLAPTIKSLLL